ncbi:MAG: extracellular solute-binding protein [Spirochaetaceae bacterium]|jgi:putative aldouronate transport system substrate-binding protein|nr:extracellular solute-binding protein [Spirochaetaceae bacterium]
MMKKLERSAAACIPLVCLVLLGSCGGKSGDSGGKSVSSAAKADLYTPAGSFPITKEPITMTMFAMSAPNVIDLQTNDFTKYLEEKTNIRWNFVTAPDDSAIEKMNLLLSSNEYPDVFMFRTPNVTMYGMQEGILIPLEDLIPQYMPNYWKFMQENPELWAQQRQADGHIYGIASFNECYHCTHYYKLWANMDWIEKIGLGVPTTTEEFKAVCKRFLELKPDGIAITGSTTGWGEQFVDFLLGSFITSPGRRPTNDRLAVSPSGEVVTIANQPQYREALRFLRELYAQGGIYDGGFTQESGQYRSLVNQPGAPVLFLASGAIVNSVDAETNPALYKAYRAVAPFKGPDGTRINTNFKYDSLQENKLVITDRCKYPEAVLRWADHFYTLEGYLQYQYGANLDGKDFVLNPPGEVGLNGKPALFKVLNQYTAEAQNHDWQDIGLIYATADIRLGEATDPNIDITSSAGLEKLLVIETETVCEPYSQKPDQFDVLPARLKLTSEEANSVQTIGVELVKYIDENQVAFITGRKSLDADWNAYLAGFDRLGLPEYLKVNQAAWNRQQGK